MAYAKCRLSTVKTFLFGTLLLLAGNVSAAYPVVEIHNTTDYDFDGWIHYASDLCKNDRFIVKRHSSWKAKSRGVCLVTKIDTGRGSRLSEAKKDTAFWPLYTKQAEAINTKMKSVKYITSPEFTKDSENIKTIPNYNDYFLETIDYDSTGTSYSKFYISKFNDTYRVLSHAEKYGDTGGYPLVHIYNKSSKPIYGVVEYDSALCKDDDYSVPAATVHKEHPDQIVPGEWRAASRGVCLVKRITATATGADIPLRLQTITNYQSTGTSYSKFTIQLFEGGYKIYSEEEFKTEVERQNRVKSPGFKIHNYTYFPVQIGLKQLGCLYQGIINPEHQGGKPFVRGTGAVWFTISAKSVPWGAEGSSDWDCVGNVAELVVSVAFAAATGGVAGIAEGAAEGAASVATDLGEAAAASMVGEESADIGAKQIVYGIVKGVGDHAAEMSNTARAAAAATTVGTTPALGYVTDKVTGKKTGMTYEEANKFNIPVSPDSSKEKNGQLPAIVLKAQAIQAWNKSEDIRQVSLAGQYAGFAWPWRCDHMPEYHISGGPTPGDWSKGSPLTIRKVNACGDAWNGHGSTNEKDHNY